MLASSQSFYVSTVCAAVYGTLCVLILVQARQRLSFLLAACCLFTAFWAGVGSIQPDLSSGGFTGALDICRMLVWNLYLLYLYARAEIANRLHLRGFSGVAIISLVLTLAGAVLPPSHYAYSLVSIPTVARLCISISTLLLVENLYFNLPEYARWHVAIPCVLLGGIACLDILVTADAVVLHTPSVQLITTRTVVLAAVAPLLVLAAFRGERWSEPVRLSREAVFHSATLVLSGSVLLALAVTGELLRRIDGELGWIAELSFVSLGVLSVLLFLSSRSARSIFQKVVVRHFFADRYDYRHQWLRCISTLSSTGSYERTDLSTRAIRAVSDVVDSPNGSLFIYKPLADVMSWAGSWNMPVGSSIPIHTRSIHDVLFGSDIVDLNLSEKSADLDAILDQLGPVWLIVPLLHNVSVIGIVLVGPSRTSFVMDQEVRDLLRIVGREVGTYIAEQQATESILQTRELHEYSQRFAFVAHDIKNVSSQLALLLANAERHLANPEFQKDMLQTVSASVQKISALLKRLDNVPAAKSLPLISPIPILQNVVISLSQVESTKISFQHDGENGLVQIAHDDLAMAVTHLITNAIEASPGTTVELALYQDSENVVIDVTDHGRGMTSNFIRDELFTPLRTTKSGGSGIGAYQARQLVQSARGQLLVLSTKGVGTTMRITLPRFSDLSPLASECVMQSTIGD